MCYIEPVLMFRCVEVVVVVVVVVCLGGVVVKHVGVLLVAIMIVNT
jgi:hypothetical protein